MKQKNELLEALRVNRPDFPDDVEEEATPSLTYMVNSLCEGGKQSRSTYHLDGSNGYFRQDICGRKSRGALIFAVDFILVDSDWGSFEGWIYNVRSKSSRSYFFSKYEIFPDDFPGMYLVCEGKPFVEDDPPDYDVFSGLGATRFED